ncbi:HAD family hydrolase [Streptomyces sp. NPDC057433]|uniref:HAD family hydrolase n=1 Tax=Streptomyces sp. NPDC057433 TaxID=3346132 RepID=UPI0036838657
MSTLVVFDCFETLLTSRPLPRPEDLTVGLSDALRLEPSVAAAVTRLVYGTLFGVMTDPGALQPATMDLLDEALREQGTSREPEELQSALWRALRCDDPGHYLVCEPGATAARRTAEAGHTVRLLSNCYLPGNLMRDLLRNCGVPEVFDKAMFSADGGPKKPDPRAFQSIAEGSFERRVMVGDSLEIDLSPAAALGWETIQITPGVTDLSELCKALEV